MLTARDAVEDRITGLDGGADDYLTKPFSFAELLARLRALVRRGAIEKPTVLEVGDLRLDPAAHHVSRGGETISLSAKEYSLLEAFMRRPGDVLSRFQLLEQAWDYEYENRSNIVDVYVRYLREKIDRPFGVNSIETVGGPATGSTPTAGGDLVSERVLVAEDDLELLDILLAGLRRAGVRRAGCLQRSRRAEADDGLRATRAGRRRRPARRRWSRRLSRPAGGGEGGSGPVPDGA